MNKLQIKIKDDDKVNILLNLLRELPFVEIEEEKIKIIRKTLSEKKYSIDDLFGLWENRTITLKDVRRKAWNKG